MVQALITGINGFVGAHLASYLLARGDDVVGLVRTTSDTRRLRPLFERHPDRLRLVIGDLTLPATLQIGLDAFDYVYHLGAVVMGLSEEEFQSSVVDGTRNLLDAVESQSSGRLQRFLFVSSLAAAGPSPNGEPLTENDPPRPVSWYGTAKRDAEDLVLERGQTGLSVTIVRPSAIVGETETDMARGVIPAVRSGFLPRMSGDRAVSYVYVGDLCEGMVAAAESPATRGKTYFLCDDTRYRARDFSKACADALGTKVRIPFAIPLFLLGLGARLVALAHVLTRGRPAVTRDKVRELRQRYWTCTAAAAQRDFGWVTSTSLTEGVKREVSEWKEEQKARHPAFSEPCRTRALKTFLLIMVSGAVLETIALGGGWYQFSAPWPRSLDWVVVALFWLLVLGTATYLTARLRVLWQIVIGGGTLTAVELLNHFALDWWAFDQESPLGTVPGPWLRAIVTGLLVGTLAVALTNAVVGALFRRQLRIG